MRKSMPKGCEEGKGKPGEKQVLQNPMPKEPEKFFEKPIIASEEARSVYVSDKIGHRNYITRENGGKYEIII